MVVVVVVVMVMEERSSLCPQPVSSILSLRGCLCVCVCVRCAAKDIQLSNKHDGHTYLPTYLRLVWPSLACLLACFH